MASAHDASCPHCSGRGLLGSIGVGVAAGVAVAAGVMFGRKAITTARVSRGHPLKHRVLDLGIRPVRAAYPR
jgi:hypothetical protein